MGDVVCLPTSRSRHGSAVPRSLAGPLLVRAGMIAALAAALAGEMQGDGFTTRTWGETGAAAGAIVVLVPLFVVRGPGDPTTSLPLIWAAVSVAFTGVVVVLRPIARRLPVWLPSTVASAGVDPRRGGGMTVFLFAGGGLLAGLGTRASAALFVAAAVFGARQPEPLLAALSTWTAATAAGWVLLERGSPRAAALPCLGAAAVLAAAASPNGAVVLGLWVLGTVAVDLATR